MSGALDGAGADVLAVLHAVEADALHRLVRACAGHLHRVAERGGAQHPAAVRDEGLALRAGPGVEHPAIVRRHRNPCDRVALARIVWIAVRGEHDTERRAAVPGRLHPRKAARERGLGELEQVGLEPQQDRLGLRVAEAAVELDRLRIAGLVDHQAGVQEAAVGEAVLRQPLDGGLDDLAHHPGVDLGRDDRRRGIRAHAAGVGTLVAVAQALVVLARGERQYARAIAHNDEARFLALHELLDYHPRARFAEALLVHHALDRGLRLLHARGHHHALSRREAVGLDDDGRATLRHERLGEIGALERAIQRGRDVVAHHERLGEVLGRLELRRGASRTEDLEARVAEGIHHARGERRLGADHREVDAFLLREGDQIGDLRERDVLEAALARRAAVAGSDEHLLHLGTLRESRRWRARVPPTRSRGASCQWRKCRTPVKIMATPRSSAAAMTSASRMLPPGWMTAAAPASASASSPSRNGKNASEATTEPLSETPASAAFVAAMRTLSTRLICPAPTPSVVRSRQKTMAFDFTYLATHQAKTRSARCASLGAARVTSLKSLGSSTCESLVCTSRPPPTRL